MSMPMRNHGYDCKRRAEERAELLFLYFESLAGSDRPFVRETLRVFFNSATDTLSEMEIALLRGDFGQVARLARRLLGSVCCLGEDSLVKSCARLQGDASRTDAMGVRKQLEELRREFQTFKLETDLKKRSRGY